MNTSTLLAACAALVMAASSPLVLAQISAKQESKAQGLNQQDAKMMQELARADLAEVQAGKLAASKAASPEVKKFAQHMVDEHGKQIESGKTLAKSKGVEPPSAPDKKHEAAMKQLEAQSGAEFDRAYMNQMVKDHEEALKLAQNAAKGANDAELKAAAQKAVPVIQKHLEMAKSIAASLK